MESSKKELEIGRGEKNMRDARPVHAINLGKLWQARKLFRFSLFWKTRVSRVTYFQAEVIA